MDVLRGTLLPMLLCAALVSRVAAQDLELLPPLDEVLPSVPADPPPEAALEVEAQPAPDYTWYQPAYYFDPEIWDGDIEFGVNGAAGNTESFNVTAGYNLKRESERTVLQSDLKYFNASNNSIQTQNYAIFNAGVEWKSKSKWSTFARTQIQFNEFQSWDLLLVLNAGLSYRLIDAEVSKVKLRAGAGTSREFGGLSDEWKPEALFGVDAEHKINDRQKLVSKMDYYPSWEDFNDYRLVSDTSWQIVLDQATNLSLKLGVVTNYDSTPEAGKVGSDINYVALLLWKL